MGMKESLVVDWKDKTIEYQGKTMYIVEQFEFEGREYFYAVDVDTVESKKLEVTFLYRIKDDVFAHVEDEKLYEQLIITGGAKVISAMIVEDIRKLKHEGKL